VETLAWEVFESHLREKYPSSFAMGGTRGVRIGFTPESQSIFIRLPINPNTFIPPSPYAEIFAEVLKDETGFVLEIKTTTMRLFREFHRFAEIITEDFEKTGQTAQGAFETAIRRWNDLTSRKELLSDEQRLGLQGELVFLNALLNTQETKAILSWTGRNKSLSERHDFRINGLDIEIKSTRSTSRRHIIHGLGQLQASLGHKLYLLSLKFEGAGLVLGRSLYDEVENIRLHFSIGSAERKDFEDRLLAAGYRDEDSEHYQEKLILADQPMLIYVDDKCPKITTEIISTGVPSEVSGRIDDVSYRVNLEGLGVAHGSREFINILGKIQLEGK